VTLVGGSPLWASVIVAGLIDAGIVCLLWIVGVHADGLHDKMELHAAPSSSASYQRTRVLRLVTSFANMTSSAAVCALLEADVSLTAGLQKPHIVTEKVEALYFSMVTMTTLGYGDVSPATRDARILVICQLASGLGLLILLFPLVMSRFADF
jgi:voltage-gated potassium channel Kch